MDLVNGVVIEPGIVVIEGEHPDIGVGHIRQSGRLGHPVRDIEPGSIPGSLRPCPPSRALPSRKIYRSRSMLPGAA
ncbi:hypothetical protein MSAR_47020 [Mycolicibacterium sarraceniae]|uniref:Uncharacterized protein n=1 Tax=Mycolicibacterium sarraceniae TaxID=1534348 RepID=A0A7I7T0H9_9MYCO|nr:hypothetical protein MSAR_47020 [Mycolicibacterium sarraceniae]